MADVSKLKKKGLGTPPSVEDIAMSLTSPEVAPLSASLSQAEESLVYVRRDRRKTRKTHRILPFATRVSPEFDVRFRDIADKEDLTLAELLELMLDAFEKQQGYK